MNTAATKQQTANGKEFARFTLAVNYKPEYQLPHKGTGEVREKWWYRSDLENKKYFTATGYEFENEVDVLAMVYQRDKHKYTVATFYNNETGKMFGRFINGEMDFPKDAAKVIRFNAWLKRCQK